VMHDVYCCIVEKEISIYVYGIVEKEISISFVFCKIKH